MDTGVAVERTWFRPVAGTTFAYVLVLAGTLLNPSAAAPSRLVLSISSRAQGWGVPIQASHPARVEFALNAAAFALLVFLLAWMWAAPRWHQWTAWGFVGSFSVEAFQALFLDGRSAQHVDVVANTLGALLGYVAITALRGSLPPAARHPAGPPDRSP